MSDRCRLYLISPPSFDLPQFADDLDRALDAGDVASFQLRLKDVSDDEIRRTASWLIPIVQRKGVAFLLNDRPDLAKALSCDGVHIGQEDAPYEEAREAMGKEAIIGVTCHASRHLAMVAAPGVVAKVITAAAKATS